MAIKSFHCALTALALARSNSNKNFEQSGRHIPALRWSSKVPQVEICQLFSLCSWAPTHTHCQRTMAITKVRVLYNFSRAATQHPLGELAALYFASFILLCRCHYYYLLLCPFLWRRTRKVFRLSGGEVKTPLTRTSSPPYACRTCGNYAGLSKIDGVLSCEW